MDEVERTLKINLFNRAFVDETVQFIPAQERWQVPSGLVQMGLSHLEQIIGRHASSYTQDSNYGQERQQKTATEVMAQVQSTASLVSAALAQAYEYKKAEYREICNRFCKKNSRDPEVRAFRNQVLKAGVPEECLDTECWEIEPERVMGAGNKTLEIAVAKELLGIRPMLDPEPQREVSRNYVLAISDDAALANRLVPDTPVKVTDSVHDAQLAVGPLMMGFRVDVKTGINHIEYIETLLHEAALKMKQIEGTGAMATQQEIIGLQNLLQHIAGHIQILSQDKTQQEQVREYGDDLKKLGNILKGYMQRLAEQQQAQGNGNGGIDAEAQAKIQATMIAAQAKAANSQKSNAQRTAQRQTQFEMEMLRDAQRHQFEMQKERDQHMLDVRKQIHQTRIDGLTDLMKTTDELNRNRMKAVSEEE